MSLGKSDYHYKILPRWIRTTQRGAKKDFIDIYTLLTQQASLTTLLKQYQHVEDTISVLYGLAYFNDAEDEPNPLLLGDFDWDRVKKKISKDLKEVYA